MVRANNETRQQINAIAKNMGCDAAEVVQIAVENMDALLNSAHLHQWPALVQAMHQMDETTDALAISMESMIEVLKLLTEIEAELSFNLDDLKDSVYVPRELMEKYNLKTQLAKEGGAKPLSGGDAGTTETENGGGSN